MTPPERDRPLVILSPERWDDVARTNKHQLARQFAARRPTLYVDMPGFPPSRRGLGLRGKPAPGVRLVSIPALPQRLQKRIVAAARVQEFLSLFVAAIVLLVRHGLRRPDVLVYFPYPIALLALLRPRTVAYHCVDHHASFPDLEQRRGAIERDEARLIERAAFVMASSPALERHCRQLRDDVAYLPNVADVELWGAVPAWRDSRGGRAVFFHGTFSEHKVDRDLLAAVAASPGVRLVLAGVLPDDDAKRWMETLSTRPNVEFLGPLPQEDIVGLLGSVDVLLLPYVVGNHTEYVFPLKLVEYLATGLPVVATRLPSIVESVNDLVRYVDSFEALPSLIDGAVADAAAMGERRRAFAADRSWQRRILEIEELFERSNPPFDGVDKG